MYYIVNEIKRRLINTQRNDFRNPASSLSAQSKAQNFPYISKYTSYTIKLRNSIASHLIPKNTSFTIRNRLQRTTVYKRILV